MATDADQTEHLAEQVRSAAASGTRLAIQGGGSKAFHGHPPDGAPIDVRGHRGIRSYEPTELILTARAGTPLAEIEALLADNGQMLAFEPPSFDGGATLGGVVSAGIAGPRRLFAGAVRDHVLGVRLIDGQGQVQHFGGEVMKNVAGYDVARLVTGALGTLGIVLEVSLKVLPRPEVERTVCLRIDADDMQLRVENALRAGAPVTAAAHDGEVARIRLGGARSAVDAGAQRLDGEPADDELFWQQLRDQQLPFFTEAEQPIWRIALPPATRFAALEGQRLFDWNAQLLWLRSSAEITDVRAAAASAGGHATLFRGARPGDPVFTPLTPALHRLHERLKQVFDPAGILNHGRMYPEF